MQKIIFIFFILWSTLFFTTGLGAAESLDSAFYALGFRLPEKTLPAVDFELEDLGGNLISLSSMRGKVIFLNFWATWCPPCRAEMPSMEELYNRFASRDFEIVAVDLQEKNKQVSKFVNDNGLTFKILLDKTGNIGAAYGARSIPTTYIIDRDGSVLARTLGGREWDTEEVFDLFEKILSR
ncbi:Thiol-disulfide oxidoreductase ResA [subsurface metagenome]